MVRPCDWESQPESSDSFPSVFPKFESVRDDFIQNVAFGPPNTLSYVMACGCLDLRPHKGMFDMIQVSPHSFSTVGMANCGSWARAVPSDPSFVQSVS